MKYTFTIIIFFVLFNTSCKKEANTKTCYECDVKQNNQYVDSGCWTADEWKAINFTDNLGNDLDKSKICRKK